MTTLITGGAGFIGSYLAQLLVEDGEHPVLLDVAPVHGALVDIRDRFEYVQSSLGNLSVLQNLVRKYSIDRIFHLGGMLSVPSDDNPWAAFDTNVVGTYNVLEAARLAGVTQVICSSPIATYGRDLPATPVDDATIQRPTSMYGSTKVFCELLGRFYARKFGLDFRGVRIPSVVGPGAKTAHMSIYNCWAIEESLKGNPYELLCEPDTRCPVIYFKDAGRALWLLAKADRSQIKTMIYNLAGIVPPFSADELVYLILKRIPDARLTFNPDPETVELLRELGSLILDDECARAEWGWEIAYPLIDMVDDFIKEFKEHTSWYV
ncbi:MAG: NAD-dependent epimerase/dehydratase family protein [Deltaproteobacteria bacterium]|nr:NAD-dependent epimerase/dehydratase family protein [Deltaproteobacteria bacterium]